MKTELSSCEIGVVSGGIEGSICCCCDIKYWSAAVNFIGYIGMAALPAAIVVKPFGLPIASSSLIILGVSAIFGAAISASDLWGK